MRRGRVDSLRRLKSKKRPAEARVWRITRAEPHRWSHAPCKRFNSNVRARCPGSAKSVSRSHWCAAVHKIAALPT